MKLVIVLSALLGLCLAEFYPGTYDNFNVEKYKDTETETPQRYYVCGVIDCYMDDAKCDTEHEFFKPQIQDVFNTACARCSPARKHILEVFLTSAAKLCPYRMLRFYQKFDPNQNLKPALLESIKRP